MILIHGKIKSFEVLNNNDIKFTLVGNIVHEYLYENNKIYYLAIDLLDYNKVEKKITLCENVESDTNFGYDDTNNKLTTTVQMGGRTYRNNYSIVFQN